MKSAAGGAAASHQEAWHWLTHPTSPPSDSKKSARAAADDASWIDWVWKVEKGLPCSFFPTEEVTGGVGSAPGCSDSAPDGVATLVARRPVQRWHARLVGWLRRWDEKGQSSMGGFTSVWQPQVHHGDAVSIPESDSAALAPF